MSGVAVFTSLALSLPGLYSIRFKASTLQSSADVLYNASAPKEHLSMWRPPTGDVAAVVLVVQPHVALRDLYNVTVCFFSSSLLSLQVLEGP